MGQCAYQSESQSESHLTLPERVPERESEPVPLSGSVRVPEREPERAHPDPPLHLTCTPNFILRLLPFTPPPLPPSLEGGERYALSYEAAADGELATSTHR